MTTKIYVPGAYNYVNNAANNAAIIAYASALNVSKTAVVAAIVKEHDGYLDKLALNEYSDWYVSSRLAITPSSVIDEGSRAVVAAGLDVAMTGHGFFNQVRINLTKVAVPLLGDLGAANIKLTTAIQLINDYAAQHPSDDPLNLKQFIGHFNDLPKALVNQNSEVTAAVSVLMVKQGTDFFTAVNPETGVPRLDSAQWSALSAVDQDALLTMYFTLGKTQMAQRYENNLEANGGVYVPQLDDGNTAGGQWTRDNAAAIGAVVGATGYGSPGPNPLDALPDDLILAIHNPAGSSLPPISYAGTYAVRINDGGTLSHIVAAEAAKGNTITVADIRAVNSNLNGVADTAILPGTALLVPQRIGSTLVVDSGEARISFNPATGEYLAITQASADSPAFIYERKLVSGVLVDQFIQSDSAINGLDLTTGNPTTLPVTITDVADHTTGTLTIGDERAGGQVMTVASEGAGQYAVTADFEGESVTFSATPSATEQFRLTELRAIDGVAVDNALVDAAIADSDINAHDLLLARGAVGQIVTFADPTDTDGIRDATTTPATPWTIPSEVQRLGASLTSIQGVIAAINSGNGLGFVTSAFNTMDILSGGVDGTLADIGAGLNGATAILSLKNAVERGDMLSALSSGLTVSKMALTMYQGALSSQVASIAGDANFIIEHVAASARTASQAATVAEHAALNTELAQVADALKGIGQALPFISALISLKNGDYEGAIVALVAIQWPVVGWIYAAVQLINSWLVHDTPHGIAYLLAGGADGSEVEVMAHGELNGDNACRNVMRDGLLMSLKSSISTLTDNAILADRVPTLHFIGEASTPNGTWSLSFIDSKTGVATERFFNMDGGMIGETLDGVAVEIAGTEGYYLNMPEQFVNAAWAAGAIAPRWEVATAYQQHQNELPQAGLSTLERAKLNGPLLANTGDTQTVRPIVLDLGADLIRTSDEATGGAVLFDVDNDGFAEQTNWVSPRDGMLVLDRDGNGRIDTGHELFSDARVNTATRGMDVLKEIDANGDELITSLDPVFTHLRVWQDITMDGVAQDFELGSSVNCAVPASAGCLAPAGSPPTLSKRSRVCATRARTDCTPRARFGTRRFGLPQHLAPNLPERNPLPCGTHAHCLRAV